MMDRQQPRASGVPAITDSKVGAAIVRLMAEGLLGVCDMYRIPYPRTEAEYEATLVEMSRGIGLQAGLSFHHKPTHQKLYELIGIPPHLAGLPHKDLIALADHNPSLQRSVVLLAAFATPANAATRDARLAQSAEFFRDAGGPEYELIARAFEAGDCQRDLVFAEMQVIIRAREDGRADCLP